MNQKIIGYVAVKFEKVGVKALIDFAKLIPKKDLFFKQINGQIEGGNVANKAHLTLFFGLDDKNIDKIKIDDFIHEIKLQKIYISGVDAFDIESFGCKVIVLKVNDDFGTLKKINERLNSLAVVDDLPKFDFKPHITIAYVNADYDITDDMQKNFPSELVVSSVEYLLKK